MAAAAALAPSDNWASASYARAGRAAHAANREHEAFAHYQRAGEIATSVADSDAATLGKLAAAIDLELPEAPQLLAELTPGPDANAESLVLYFSRWLNLHWRFGTFGDLHEARRVYRLLHSVKSPIIRCSFRNAYGFTVASAGEIDEAREVIASQQSDATQYRLAFALPYVRVMEAIVELLLGRFDRVTALLTEIERAGRLGDDFLTANAVAIRTRALIAQGRFKEAVRESLRPVGTVPVSTQGELIASRAIALACDQELERALSTAESACALTGSIEVRVCSAVTRAIVAALRADAELFELAREALKTARTHYCVECFVSGYRGFPELAHVLLQADETREEILAVISIAGDTDRLAEAAQPVRSGGTWEDLSPREREVLTLVAEGWSNKQIASRLYIANGTAKVHVSHILEKLGVPSRTAAALRVPHHARAKQPPGQEPD